MLEDELERRKWSATFIALDCNNNSNNSASSGTLTFDSVRGRVRHAMVKL